MLHRDGAGCAERVEAVADCEIVRRAFYVRPEARGGHAGGVDHECHGRIDHVQRQLELLVDGVEDGDLFPNREEACMLRRQRVGLRRNNQVRLPAVGGVLQLYHAVVLDVGKREGVVVVLGQVEGVGGLIGVDHLVDGVDERIVFLTEEANPNVVGMVGEDLLEVLLQHLTRVHVGLGIERGLQLQVEAGLQLQIERHLVVHSADGEVVVDELKHTAPLHA